MYMTLYRKYRPTNFEEVAGQKEIVKTIKNSLKNGKYSQAYLFTGPRGVGKTTMARLIAKGLSCLENGITDEPCNHCENCISIGEGTFMDMVEIDAASNRGIDEIRQLKEKINYQPVKGRKKIYIIDEVHMLTKEAFNALLKTLEEPPSHVVFILATTEVDKVLPTIISRCQRYDFKTLTVQEMREQLIYIANREGIELSEEVANLIYENSGGSVRDAVSILERVMIASLGEKITLDKAEKVLGVTPTEKMDEFLKEIKGRKYGSLAKMLDSFWEESMDIELFFKDLAKYTKTLISKGSLQVEEGISIIGTIYESLSKFKYEEDKRLVGYVIIDNLVKKSRPQEVVIEKVVEKEVYVPTPQDRVYENKKDDDKNTLEGVTFELISARWEDILKEAKRERITLGAFLIGAKPHKLEGETLFIAFGKEAMFCKEQMETSTYNDVFVGVVRKLIHPNIKLKYVILGGDKEIKKDSGDFTKKIVDFFGGEIIE